MNIKFNDIGTEFQKFDLFLDVDDYTRLFKEEVAFGKLLKIYIELAKIITENPQKLKEWVSSDTYKEVLAVSERICDEVING